MKEVNCNSFERNNTAHVFSRDIYNASGRKNSRKPRGKMKTEAVPSLGVFQARWVRTCNNLVRWKVSLSMDGGDELKGHLQPKPF